MNKDLYSILGLTKGCSDADIKKAYRKLSMKWHPDKWVNGTEAEKKTAENKFKEIADAYSILSDSEKRKNYDQFGDPNGRNFDGIDDIFKNMANMDEMFNGFMHKNVQRKPEPLIINLTLTINEIFNGGVKKIKYNALRKCTYCNGSGMDKDGHTEVCHRCGGSGRIVSQHKRGFIIESTINVCPDCGGSGKIIINPCPHCGGSGLYNTVLEYNLNLPKYIQDNAAYRIADIGNMGMNNVIGDLVIVFKVIDNEFKINKNKPCDVTVVKEIPILRCIIGGKEEVKGIDGKLYKIELPQGIKDGGLIRLAGKGLPKENGYGDLYIEIRHVMPKKMSSGDKKIIEKLLEKKNFGL